MTSRLLGHLAAHALCARRLRARERSTLLIGGVGGSLAVLWLLGTPPVRVRSADDLVAG